MIPRVWKAKLDNISSLFWVFFRISPLTFGGGYAMMPVIEREVVEKKGWIDRKEWSEMISLAGSAPGGVGVNAAAFVGFRRGGVPGAIASVAGVTLPAFLIVIVLSLSYMLFKDNAKVAAALKGVHGAIVALILLAANKMAKTSINDLATMMISAAALLVLLFIPVSPLYVVVCGIPAGIVLVKAKELLGAKVNFEQDALNAAAAPEPMYPEYYI